MRDEVGVVPVGPEGPEGLLVLVDVPLPVPVTTEEGHAEGLAIEALVLREIDRLVRRAAASGDQRGSRPPAHVVARALVLRLSTELRLPPPNLPEVVHGVQHRRMIDAPERPTQ